MLVEDSILPWADVGIRNISNPAAIYNGPPPGYTFARVCRQNSVQKKTGANPIATIQLGDGCSIKIFLLHSRNVCHTIMRIFTLPFMPEELEDID